MASDNDQTNVIGADATSGASATDKAGSGAFALDIFLAGTTATVGLGTAIDAGAGNLALSADEATRSTVNALPAISKGLPGQPEARTVLGVGIAVALNIVETDTRAELLPAVHVVNAQNPALAGAHDVSLKADSKDDLKTTATAGASVPNPSDDGEGIGAEAAISILLATTDASIAPGGALIAGHDVSVVADHADTNVTTGDGFGQSGGTAIGIAIGFTYVDSETTATVGEGLTAENDVLIGAQNATASDTISRASTAGGKAGGGNQPVDSPDQAAIKQRDLGDSYATGSGGKATGPTSNPKASTSSGSVAVAGALSVEIVGASKALATTADGLTIVAGGSLTLAAGNDTDAHAGAVGSTTGDATKGVGVGIALSIAPTVLTTAALGADSKVHAKGITIAAGMSGANDSTNRVGADASSGASASDKAGAGALGLSLFFEDVEATPGQGSQVDAMGGPVSILATSNTVASASAIPAKKGVGGKTTGVGVSIAIEGVEDTTSARVPDTTTITDAGGLFVIAASHDDASTTSEAGASAPGGNAGAGGGSFTVVLADTTARVGTGADLTVAGDVLIGAGHSGDSSATVDSDAKGADTVVGASLAVNYEDISTTADFHRNMTAGLSFSIDAHTQSAGVSGAKAAASGAQGSDQNTPPNGVDQQAASQRSYVNGQITDNGGQGASTNDNTSAKTSGGGISVAAAVAIEIAHVHSTATIPDGLTVHADGGPLTVSACDDAGSTASADGTEAGKSNKTGIGAAVAINFVDTSALAEIGDDTIASKGLVVEATQGLGPHLETISASAVSGAGAKNTGIAGAVALNLVLTESHDARIDGGAKIDAGGGPVAIVAGAATLDIASATAADGGMVPANTGIGASVAVNVVLKDVRAEVQDGASLIHAGTFLLDAESGDGLITFAKNGAQGSTAVGISAGVTYIKNDTVARVGTGPALDASGDAIIHANIQDHALTTTDSAAAGDETAVGLSIAVGIVRTSADASLNRNLSAGGQFSLTTDDATSSDVTSTASATGMSTGTENSDEQSKDQFSFVDLLSNQNESGNSPSVKDQEDSANGQSTGQTGMQSKDQVGVAATIAVNVELVHMAASVADGLTVTAAGPVTIATNSDVDGSASALGVALQLSAQESKDTTVAAAVAVDVVLLDDTASVGAGDAIQGHGITVAARTATPSTTDDYRAMALSGAGGTGDSGAGSASLNVLDLVTTASVGTGAALNSTGTIDVLAQSPVRLEDGAGGAALGKGKGVGLAIAVNIVSHHTTSATIGDGSTIDAVGALTVAASASLTPVAGALPGDLTSAAIGAAGSQDTAVGGSILVDVVFETTHAEIGAGSLVNGTAAGLLDQSVIVTATDAVTLHDAAGGLGISTGGDGVGAGLLVSVLTADTAAKIDDGVTVKAGGDVVVRASEAEDLLEIAVAGAIGDGDAVAVTVAVFVPLITTQAGLGASDHVTAGGNVIVGADHDFTAFLVGGTLAVGGGSASFGAEVATIVLIDQTDASIGHDASVVSHGRTPAIDVPTGAEDANGQAITEPVDGVAVTATTRHHVQTFAIGGAISGSGAAISGSAAVNVDQDTTLAHIDHGATVLAADNKPGTGPSVVVLASDTLVQVSAGGALAGGDSEGVGIGVDVGVIAKQTEASIDALGVGADSNVIVRANSSEDFTSVSATLAAAGEAAIGGAAGVYVVNDRTRAFIGSAGNDGPHLVEARGNVMVAARESLGLVMLAGSITAAPSAAVGVGAGVPIINKTTEAFIGEGSTVVGLGLGGTIDADTGEFGQVLGAYSPVFGATGPSSQSGRPIYEDSNHNKTMLPQNGAVNHSADSVPLTQAMRGVAVTATNKDKIDTIGVNAGASGSVAVNVTGVVNILTNVTTAHVDAGATINSNNPGAAADQSVRVAAGDAFSQMAAAAGLAASGSVAVTAAATVLIANETTLATVADGAHLWAKGDINVEAHASEELLTVAATLAVSGTASVGGAVSVVVLNDVTRASLGDKATTDPAGATADAGGNVVVAASDDTDSLTVAGGVSVGGDAGVGAAVAVTIFNKDTRAFVGDHATVNASASSSPIDGVVDGTIKDDGTFEALPGFRGLAVQATSSETVLQVGAEAAAGFYLGLGGGVTIELFNSNTNAYIGRDAHINPGTSGASQGQSVNVAAANRVKDFSLGGGIGVGVVGIGGGVDVGVLRNNTSGFIDAGTDVHANGDIHVYGLSSEDITTFAISGAGGLGAVSGSVSVWSIGSAFQSSYSDDGQSADGLDSSNQSPGQTSSNLKNTTSQSMAMTGKFTSATDSFLDPANNPALAPAKGVGTAHSMSNSSIASNSGGDEAGEAIGATLFTAGTSAQVRDGAFLKAGGDVGVHAIDHLVVTANVGNISGGFVAVGASVAIVNIHSHVEATIGKDVEIDAQGDVSVTGLLVKDHVGFTILAGSVGVAALGAQVVLVHDDSTQDASIGEDSTIIDAASVLVDAAANRDVDGTTLDAKIGGLAVGVTYVDISLTGSTAASIGDGVHIGGANGRSPVGDVSVLAVGINTAKDDAFAVTAGAISGAGQHVSEGITPSVSATVGSGVDIEVGGSILVDAVSSGDASAHLFNATIGVIAVTVMTSDVTVSPTVVAAVGPATLLQAGGSIDVAGSHDFGPNGALTSLGAHAMSQAPGGGGITGTGVAPQAIADATVVASVADGTALKAGDRVSVTSSLSNNADAQSDSASLGALGVGVSLATAEADGSSTARLDGDVLQAGDVRVVSLGSNHADAEATAVGASGVMSAEGASASADASPVLLARIGGGPGGSIVHAGGDVQVSSASASHASAVGHSVAIGGLFSLGLVASDAKVDPKVSATVGGGSTITTPGGSIDVSASHDSGPGPWPGRPPRGAAWRASTGPPPRPTPRRSSRRAWPRGRPWTPAGTSRSPPLQITRRPPWPRRSPSGSSPRSARRWPPPRRTGRPRPSSTAT